MSPLPSTYDDLYIDLLTRSKPLCCTRCFFLYFYKSTYIREKESGGHEGKNNMPMLSKYVTTRERYAERDETSIPCKSLSSS